MTNVAAPAAALGYSIVSNLDGNRQITVQCFVPEDEADEVVNAKLDRVFRVIDRQKARYDLVTEHEELEKEEKILAQLNEDLARIDVDFDVAQATLDEHMVEFDQQHKELFDEGYEAHVNTGRKGKYKPAGFSAGQLRAIDQAKANAADSKKKNEAEREQHRTGALISVERYKSAIAERKARIVSSKALLGT